MPKAPTSAEVKALLDWSREVRDRSRAACADARELITRIEEADRQRALARRSKPPFTERAGGD
jgi:hypothetical protein